MSGNVIPVLQTAFSRQDHFLARFISHDVDIARRTGLSKIRGWSPYAR